MNIRDRIGTIFAFNPVPTTILLVLVYAAIFTSVFVTDNLPSVPKNTRGLNVDQAWSDLHHVSARPHSFNSHANDLVRDFILGRVGDVASHYPHVTIDYDVFSNASWITDKTLTKLRGVYQEGSNILVKIQGTDPAFRTSGGYLLSAHYDSVSTGPGATDDGIGIVTLLQMVEFFAKHVPRRTVVFNFNNNEESGLNGAHAYVHECDPEHGEELTSLASFLQHPWAQIPDVFLNLEGAGAGGRPVMFRATNIAPLSSWTGGHVKHPHANVIFADAFSRGAVRSATDYSIYEKAGLDGLDFAFYRGRSRYHTMYDSVSSVKGGKKALWAMMESTYGASLALATDDLVHAQPFPRQEKPVYFELFAAALVVFSLETLFITNVVLLSTGPILLLLLAYSQHISRLSRALQSQPHPQAGENGVQRVQDNRTGAERALALVKTFGTQFWTSTKFWVALVISIGLQAALIAGYVHLNPFVIHSHPFLVFTSALSLAFLSTVFVVSFPCNVCGKVLAPEQQKLSILLQLYSFTWVLLVLSTVALRSAEVGGIYFVTAWNMCALLGCVVALVEAMTNARGFEAEGEARPETHTYLGGVRYQAVSTEEEPDGQQSSRIVEEPEPTETTPLVPRQHSHSPPSSHDDNQGAIGWWILQLLLVVPLPVILILHISNTFLRALNQTLTDGNSPAVTYSGLFLLALLLVLPMAPFGMQVHRWLTLFVLVIFVFSTVYTWVAFPFSHAEPLKIYFEQIVDLTPAGTGIELVTTKLTGPEHWLADHILPVLPSAFGKPVTCLDAIDHARGLQTCTWPVDAHMMPSPGGYNETKGIGAAPWVSYSVDRTGPASARITVQGRNTRLCTVKFANRRISKFSVVGDGDQGLQTGYEMPQEGVDEIELWSRTFEKQFEVEVEWHNEGNVEGEAVRGRVSCGWDEYERGTIGGGRSGGKIPSLEEVMDLVPEWVVVTKQTSQGLFSAGSVFSV